MGVYSAIQYTIIYKRTHRTYVLRRGHYLKYRRFIGICVYVCVCVFKNTCGLVSAVRLGIIYVR